MRPSIGFMGLRRNGRGEEEEEEEEGEEVGEGIRFLIPRSWITSALYIYIFVYIPRDTGAIFWRFDTEFWGIPSERMVCSVDDENDLETQSGADGELRIAPCLRPFFLANIKEIFSKQGFINSFFFFSLFFRWFRANVRNTPRRHRDPRSGFVYEWLLMLIA